MFALRRTVALLTLAGFAIACTEEAAVTPSTNTPGGTSVSTEPPSGPSSEPASTTAVGAETTVPPETTVVDTTSTAPTSTIAPSTTVAPVGDPTSVSTEYFLGGAAEAGLYLGRWTGTAWESDRGEDQQLREPAASSGDDIVVHELDVAPIEGTIEGSGVACASDGRTGPVISTEVAAPDEPGTGYRTIAFPADWPTSPRPVAVVNASIESYVAAGQAAFEDLAIDTSSGSIEQLVVADLDGNGDTEALVAFDGAGFSALLLIDTDTAAATTVARSGTETVTPTTVAGGDDPVETTTTPFATYRALDVVDLNGDGRLEIVVQAVRGGAVRVTVNEYDGTKVSRVLTTAC